MSFSAQPASYFQPGRIRRIMTKILITLQKSSSIVPKNFARTPSQKISRNTHIVDSEFFFLSAAAAVLPRPLSPSESASPSAFPVVLGPGPAAATVRIPVFDVMSFLGSHWFWATLYFNNVLRIGVFLLLSSKIFF